MPAALLPALVRIRECGLPAAMAFSTFLPDRSKGSN